MRGCTLCGFSVIGLFLLASVACIQPAFALTGDLDGDGTVDHSDMFIMSSDWLAQPPLLYRRGDNSSLQQGLLTISVCDRMVALGGGFGAIFYSPFGTMDGSWFQWGNSCAYEYYALYDYLIPVPKPKAIAAGNSHLLVIKPDGSLFVCDGAPAPDGNDFVAVAAHADYSVALRADGSIAAWGGIGYSPSENGFTAIAAGPEHALALRTDGSVVSWDYSGAYDVPIGSGYLAISAGAMHDVAIASDGSLTAWGDNTCGQCDVPDGNDFIAIAAGDLHTVAMRSDGSLVAWGYDWNNVLDVPTGNDFVSIAVYGCMNIAARRDASLVAWGWSTVDSRTLERVKIAAFDGGNAHTLVLTGKGGILAWGANWAGQCYPPDGNDFTAIAAGGEHNLALKEDGSIAAWGYNDYGQCDVPAGNNFVAVDAGLDFSFALRSDGTVAAWGKPSLVVNDVPDVNDIVAIAAGDDHYHEYADTGLVTHGTDAHCLALRADGTLIAWGDDSYGQCGVPDGNNFVSVFAGPGISIAIDSDGVAYVWGSNLMVLYPEPYRDIRGWYHEASPYVSVSAGEGFIIALRADGLVWTSGQPEFWLPPSEFSQIAAGRWHAIALERDMDKPGDLNGDSCVDMFDLAVLARNWMVDCNLTPGLPACQ